MSARVAILDDYAHAALELTDWSRVQQLGVVDRFDEHVTVSSAPQRLAQYQVLCTMRERMPLPRELLRQLPNLKMIAVAGAAPVNLDLEACDELGILVCSSRPPSNQKMPSTAAAELAFAMILACPRHLAAAHESMRRGEWQQPMGMALSGRTLGILGLGGIGRLVAGYAQAFGMKVQAWSHHLSADEAARAGVQWVSKETLFREADVLSIHYVLSERSVGMVGTQELSWMKPSAYLINTSRAGLVDEAALLAALQSRRIAGAGLDVFHQEPLPSDHPLRRLPNVTLTPHIGYVTEGAMRSMYAGMAEAIAAYLQGSPINVLNTPRTNP